MKRGGKRVGAGRKPNPTKQVRIPVAISGVIREIADIYISEAWEELKASTWWRTCPADEKKKIFITFKGVENRKGFGLLGTSGDVRVIVCHAKSLNGECKEILLPI